MVKKSLILMLAGNLLFSPLAYSKGIGEKFVENAKKYMDIKYKFGGRLTELNPGIDCLGLLFLAYSETFDNGWKNISVYPSEIVKNGKFGDPVNGLDGILCEDVDVSKLENGDVIYLLSLNEIGDEPLANINGIDYWSWHTGIYSGENSFLEAKPGFKVVERSFDDILKENIAIFVTRFN